MPEIGWDMQLQAAVPEMAPAASGLIYLTMRKMAGYLFGADDPSRARRLIEGLYRLRWNRFGYEFGCAALVSGEGVGLMISYPGPVMRKLELPMALQLIRLAGISGLARFTLRALPLVGVKEAEDDEYFINNVAVRPAYQGKGLGCRLLRWAEKTARGGGFRKLSLTVEAENERALSLYERAGFKVIQTVKVEALKRAFGYDGFHRMVKSLT